MVFDATFDMSLVVPLLVTATMAKYHAPLLRFSTTNLLIAGLSTVTDWFRSLALRP